MWKARRSFLSIGLVGAFVAVGACVGDPGPAQGEIGGACNTDGTCNGGLVCTNAKCAVANDAATSDAATNDSGSSDSAVDSGPRTCTFAPTPFPCTGQSAGPTCYGQAQSCALTGCPGQTDVRWECFSPNQCGNTPCCIAPTSAALTPTKDCALGGLKVLPGDAGNVTASMCSTGIACDPSEITLCQFNTQCPTGQVCSPVKISGSGTSASNVIIGACVPE